MKDKPKTLAEAIAAIEAQSATIASLTEENSTLTAQVAELTENATNASGIQAAMAEGAKAATDAEETRRNGILETYETCKDAQGIAALTINALVGQTAEQYKDCVIAALAQIKPASTSTQTPILANIETKSELETLETKLKAETNARERGKIARQIIALQNKN